MPRRRSTQRSQSGRTDLPGMTAVNGKGSSWPHSHKTLCRGDNSSSASVLALDGVSTSCNVIKTTHRIHIQWSMYTKYNTVHCTITEVILIVIHMFMTVWLCVCVCVLCLCVVCVLFVCVCVCCVCACLCVCVCCDSVVCVYVWCVCVRERESVSVSASTCVLACK